MTPDTQTAGPIALLVDDEPMIHLIVTRTLQREGWTVLNATDGEHAVEIIGRTGEPPQLVITDMRMPRMNGAELGQDRGAVPHGTDSLYLRLHGHAAPAYPRPVCVLGQAVYTRHAPSGGARTL